jgi:hypothetical protein
LLELAVAGWKTYDEFVKAARHTRDDPTAEEIVSLVRHR